jgi:hypothetical protein
MRFLGCRVVLIVIGIEGCEFRSGLGAFVWPSFGRYN